MSIREPREATAEEMRELKRAGFRDEGKGWWRGELLGQGPFTTDEALLATRIVADAYANKPGWRTREFYSVLAIALPIAGAGITAAVVPFQSLPPPWNLVATGVLTGMGAALAMAYTVVRSNLKRSNATRKKSTQPQP
jgi:hypothetical protein